MDCSVNQDHSLWKSQVQGDGPRQGKSPAQERAWRRLTTQPLEGFPETALYALARDLALLNRAQRP